MANSSSSGTKWEVIVEPLSVVTMGQTKNPLRQRISGVRDSGSRGSRANKGWWAYRDCDEVKVGALGWRSSRELPSLKG